MSTHVFTVGYEGRTVADLVEVLESTGVTRVVDVRELPLSRRRGFSKTRLRERLKEAGIGYVHVKLAGNPYRKMKARVEECLEMFRRHVDKTPEVVPELMAAVEGERAALLCVEAEATSCHRSVLADRLAERGLVVAHL